MEDGKMKKIVAILIVVLLALPVVAFADELGDELELLKKDKEAKTVKVGTKWLENRAKLGLAIGKPWGITFGYHFSKSFEGNLLVGSDFNMDGVVVGGSGLFTLVNFDISDQIFPFSIGPAAHLNFFNTFTIDALGVARIEYTFDIPLNLYIEGGLGINILDDIEFAWTAAVAARYVF
jgi:hypothetical protein